MTQSRTVTGMVVAGMVSTAVMLSGGCAPVHSRPAVTQQVTKEELREKLGRFEDSFEAGVRGAAEHLVQVDGTRRFKRLTLIWQMRLLPMLRNALDQDNPIGGFLDAWTLCVRMRHYLVDGDGKDLFGPHQHIAVRAAMESEEEIERIGNLIMTPQMFGRARERVHAVAKDHPLRGEFSGVEARSSQQAADEDVVLQAVLEIPMAPFRWLGGVDATAQSIKEFTAVAARLTDVVQGLAAEARLQAQLLLLETEDLESVQSALASMEQVAASSERLADVSERLPSEIRSELTAFFEELDSRQPEMRRTLGETRQLAEQLDPTGKSVALAGEAWAGTARAIQEMVASFRQPVSEDAAADEHTGNGMDARANARARTVGVGTRSDADREAAPYDINDYRRTAEALTETAKELQKLTAEIRDISTSDAMSARLEELTSQVRELLAGSTTTANTVTDHAAWRGLQLIFIAFVLAVVYRVVSVRWMRGPAP